MDWSIWDYHVNSYMSATVSSATVTTGMPLPKKEEKKSDAVKIKVLAGTTNSMQGCFNTPLEGCEIEDGPAVVFFMGGTDISSHIYKQSAGKQSGPFDKARDEREVKAFRECIARGIPMVGICRGAQLLCALSGGSVIQHVVGHDANHEVQSIFGSYLTTSSHHQMMNPYVLDRKDFSLISHSGYGVSNTYLGPDDKELWLHDEFVEPEVVYFRNTRCLCFQNHPEWEAKDYEFRTSLRIFNSLVKSLLDNTIEEKIKNHIL